MSRTTRFRGPTPPGLGWRLSCLANRTASLFPDRSSGIRRIPTQSYWKIENGMRRLVFSFCFRQATMRFNRLGDLFR